MLALLAGSVFAQSSVLLDQDFSIKDRAVQNLPSSAAWYFGGNGSGAGASAFDGSLQVNVGEPSKGVEVSAYLTEPDSPVTLAVGDSVTLSFDLTFGTLGASAANGLNVGIFNSGGKRLTKDSAALLGQNSAFSDWTGYACYSRIGNIKTVSGAILVKERVGGTFTLFSGNAANVADLAASDVAGNSLIGGKSYAGNCITITRTERGVAIFGQIGSNTFSAEDCAGAFDSFDAIAFGSNAGIADGSYFKLDNIKVSVNRKSAILVGSVSADVPADAERGLGV
jgi:hypothetical protein